MYWPFSSQFWNKNGMYVKWSEMSQMSESNVDLVKMLEVFLN